jgi:transposase
MSHASLPDELWEEIEPLLPPDEAPGCQGGRPRVLNKIVMRGIFFVLCTGIRWEDLPEEIGCSGMTCWRRLRDWQLLSIWDQLHRVLLAALRKAGILDLSLAVVDSSTTRAFGGGDETGPNPTDRRKPGTKQHLLVDRNGVPLEIRVTGANRHDVKEIIPLVVNMPAIAGKPGHPIEKPEAIQADRAYHDSSVDALLSWLGIEPRIAKRGTPHGSGLGKTRWVIERTISWLHGFRRLRVRFDRRDFIYHAWNSLAAAIIC